MRSVCTVALLFIIAWTFVPGYTLIVRKRFDCEKSCHTTVMDGLVRDNEHGSRRHNVKKACEVAVSKYFKVPKYFCRTLTKRIFKDEDLQENYRDLLDMEEDDALIEEVASETVKFCAETCQSFA